MSCYSAPRHGTWGPTDAQSTYGAYSLALAVAMTEATAATARRRVFIGRLLAGVVAQVLTIAWAWLADVSASGLFVVHALLAVGWGVGLVPSGFHEEMTEATGRA